MIDFILIFQIFALINPFASFPFLVAANEKRLNVKVIAVKAVLVALIIGVIIALVGPYLFKLFGITLNSFKVAGGVILLLLSIEMVRPPKDEFGSLEQNGFITIIATPLLTGPATISFVTIKAFEIGQMAVLVNLLITFAIVAVVFILFSYLIRKINHTVVDILSRVMGLFLAAVSIEMMAGGIRGIIVNNLR